MAHHSLKSGYSLLEERLNKYPQGAPPSTVLNEILKMLFSEREAELVSLLPIKPFTAEKASGIWKTDVPSAQRVLDELASRAILLDVDGIYSLPPPMAGFFEFSMMRMRSDINQKVLAELFYQYLNGEEDFIKELFAAGTTQLGRAFVQEPVLSSENALHVLDYERASAVIRTATHIGVGTCYCRHKMHHVGKACNAPMEICMSFNTTAASLTKHGYTRSVSATECLKLLDTAYELNLVQFGENNQRQVNFICNCCGCCCEAMIAARKFGILQPVHTTNFLPQISDDTCNGCGKCVNVCPVEAMTLVSANNPQKPKMKKAKLFEDICLGCGVCVHSCSIGSISLRSRKERVITPINGAHRIVLMAIERGKFQNLIFDNQALTSHRVMAAILGVILKLPPIKQAMASEQMRSKYLVSLINRLGYG
jgi:ferredoxin